MPLRSRCTRAAATTTRSCEAGCSNWRNASAPKWARYGYRVFTDSAPVMEIPLAAQSGLGWRGKHTLLLNRDAGSMFFLGEIFTDLPLPVDPPVSAHCGHCSACIDVCPTKAIVGPYRLDARRCISYLTIELKGSIPLELRPLIGNRVLGCDDCQLVCPWNKFAQRATLPDFDVRNGLDNATLVDLFAWSEEQFARNLEGSAIRRVGYERWLRNIAVGLGNAASSPAVKSRHWKRALHTRRPCGARAHHGMGAVTVSLLKFCHNNVLLYVVSVCLHPCLRENQAHQRFR